MNPTDILLSIAIVGIYTIIYVYLKSKYDDNKTIIKLFVIGFILLTRTDPETLRITPEEWEAS